jgi:hypothetical protein
MENNFNFLLIRVIIKSTIKSMKEEELLKTKGKIYLERKLLKIGDKLKRLFPTK